MRDRFYSATGINLRRTLWCPCANVVLEGRGGWSDQETFFFLEDRWLILRSFPPGEDLIGATSTHSRGEGVINLIRGFIGLIDGDLTVIGGMKGGSSE